MVCSILERMGFPVFYSDRVAKELLNSDSDIKNQLIELFGKDAYGIEGLDRAFIARQIFSDKSQIEKINSIIHPKVRANFVEWTSHQTSKIVFNEAAILFETGAYKTFDATILVTSPHDLKIKRIMQRDHSNEAEILGRMNNQWSDEQKIQLATYVISNDEQHGLLEQIEKVILILNS